MHADLDSSMHADTSQDLQSSPGGIVRWVASQTANPALRALIKEAERDKKTRPPPVSWFYPPAPSSSSASLSSSVSSAWNSTADASYLLPLSNGSSSVSSTSLASRTSEPSASRRPKPPSAAQRKPLASSTSSANQPSHHSARPRSSSYSTALSGPSASLGRYMLQDDEPETTAFAELLQNTSRTVDANSVKKQRAARTKEKGRDHLPGGIDNRTGLVTNLPSAHLLTKTSSAPAISFTRAPEKTPGTSISTRKHEPRGRALAKTASLEEPGVHLVSGKSTPASLSSSNLNCNLKLASASRLPTRASNASHPNFTAPHEPDVAEYPPKHCDIEMQDITETDKESERPTADPISRADTAMFIQVDDDEDSDTEMDVSFFKPEPPPTTRVPPPESKLYPSQPGAAPRPLVPTQRTRNGPPPLGMRRAPQLQPSQYTPTQGAKSLTVPRFKPPLLANAGGTSKNGTRTKPVTTPSSKPLSRESTTKIPAVETATRAGQEADSSFDLSFGVDADALEEAMKAYD